MSRSTKNEIKMQPKVAWGSKNRESCELSLFEWGGKFLSAENIPLPRFLYFGAGAPRPGELTCHFFYVVMSMALYGLAFAYSNPLKVD